MSKQRTSGRSRRGDRARPASYVAGGGWAQTLMMALIAAPLLYLGVWQIIFRLWPAACVAPDGSSLLCIVNDQYTRPRDLTAVAISVALALVGALALRLLIARRRPGATPTA